MTKIERIRDLQLAVKQSKAESYHLRHLGDFDGAVAEQRRRVQVLAEIEELERTFEPGDGVTWGQGSDCAAGTVVRVTAKTVFVVEDEAKLLNKAGSGEADALNFSPGGFVGHTSGTQRYEYSPGSGPEIKFTFRGTGRFKQAGASTRGSLRAWGNLSHGRRKHYDYNF